MSTRRDERMKISSPFHLLCLAVAFAGSVMAMTNAQAASVENSAQSLALIPTPVSTVLHEGSFAIDARTRIVAEGAEARGAAEQFTRLASKSHGLDLAIADTGREKGAIVFRIDPKAEGSAPESYTLDIDTKRVLVTAREASGLFYGAVTLWQALPVDAHGNLQIPALHIQDAPRFGWRGFMLDSARHFQSVDEVKQMLDAMAVHKLNTLHWHLTDDQGWRVEIKQYPKLTDIGGCRFPAGDGGKDPQSGQPRPYCGYYTQDQIRDVVKYAAERHITIVPEINVPGHSQAAVSAYPELGVTGKQIPVLNEWGVNTTLVNVEESTFQFLENVLGEVIDLFPGKYVHVGGDEAVKDQWKASPRVQERMRELGVKNEAEMQSYLIKRLEKYLVAHDRRLIGWDEILEGGLPPEATVMSWRGGEGGIEAARQGHDVVMSPSSELYLDYLQTGSPNEPPGRPATIPLKQVYAFEPVPDALDQAQQKHILGLQANMWTEHTRNFQRLQHNVFPRLAAVAETGWTPKAQKNYADFLARLPRQLQRYKSLGIGYANTPFAVDMTASDDRRQGTAEVNLSNPLDYPIHYTTDGSEPTAASALYQSPVAITLPGKISAAAFFDGKPLHSASTHIVDAASLLRRTDETLAICPDAGRLLLRLEDDGPLEGERAIFNATIFYPCWQWNAADLEDIASVKVRAGQIPYYFQLAHDEPSRTFEPARTAHGELEIRASGCKGELLASVPLPAKPGADGFIEVVAKLPANITGKQDLCMLFTGDTRPTMWVLDTVTLQPR